MYCNLCPFYFWCTLIVLLISASTRSPIVCDAADGGNYAACANTMDCGKIRNIGYPFSGGNRPSYCGFPGFAVTCESDILRLKIQNISYRVLDLQGSSQSLTVARDDLWNNTCPQSFYNTTIDFSLFNYNNLGNANISIYYNCLSPPGTQNFHVHQFQCGSNQNSNSNYFIITSAVISLAMCNEFIIVPVNGTSGQILAGGAATDDDLRNSLNSGFELQWTANNSFCDNCGQSGGRCGYTSSFVCYCKDGTYSLVCNDQNGSSSSKLIYIVVPVVGAVVASIAIGWLTLRRKGRAANAAPSESKDHPNLFSSARLTSTSSPNFTESIPSYPYSKSELGRSTSSYFGAHVFRYAELQEATSNFDASNQLGEGGFGTVYYGKLADGREIAVKQLYENNFKRVEQFMNEVEILSKLNHENLVKLYGCTSRRSRELLLVYEYIPNGTIADHLCGKRKGSVSGLLSWPVRLNMAIETAKGLAYLHESDIIHRDVKSNNILLDKNFHVKVADFGLSRLFNRNFTHVSTAPQGTPGYVDPEYYRSFQLTEKSDVYSFGVVLIELISSLEAVDPNRHGIDINLATMALNKIQNHRLHELVDKSIGFETDVLVRRMIILVAQLAFQCLQEDKDMRPSMKEVLDTLKEIQNQESSTQKAEVLDIVIDYGKDNHPSPSSPESEVSLLHSIVPKASG